MQLPIKNTKGEVVGQAEVSDVVFGAPYNPDLVHQALVMQQANQRQGTSNTLTRANVSGGGKKPWAQKHTGRARQGSTRSPQWRHGGIVFGPHPRSYRKDMPKRMRRQAIRSALSTKVTGERLFVVEGLESVESKTKAMAAVLEALGVDKSALVVARGQQPQIANAVRNLQRVKAVRSDLLNVLDLMRYDAVVMTPDAVAEANELWSETARAPRKVKTVEAA